MKPYIRILSMLMAGIFLLTACTPAPTPTQQQEATFDVNPIYTAAAETIAVESTRKAALIPTATATIEPTEEPTATPTNTATLSALGDTAIITPTLWIPMSGDTHPSISAIYDTNCRQGPDETFEVVGALRVGDTSQVYGMLPYGAWWYIKNPGKDEPKYCWVWGETTKVDGSTADVPEMSAPPTPYLSKPKVSLSISVDPATSTTCPVTVTVTASLTTSGEGNFTYSIVNDEGHHFQDSFLTFKDDGTQSVSFTKKYSSDYSGWFQMKVTNPVAVKSGKAYIQITCPDD